MQHLNDNDKDIILGDISYTNLNLLINGGDSIYANMSAVDSTFPANNNNTLATDLHLFPASFYLDLTHDGKKDLLVATNSQANAENFESMWLFSNSGTNTLPDFNFVSKDIFHLIFSITFLSACLRIATDYFRSIGMFHIFSMNMFVTKTKHIIGHMGPGAWAQHTRHSKTDY